MYHADLLLKPAVVLAIMVPASKTSVLSVLLLTVPAAHTLYTPISRPAESRLHDLAKTAIRGGDHGGALRCLETAAAHGHEGRSHLLLALHYQRVGAPSDLTRGAFRNGVAFDRGDAKLLQAWALFESKQGRMDRSVRLLQQAARQDRSALGAFRWKIFRSYNQANNPLARPAMRGQRRAGAQGRRGVEQEEVFGI